MMEQQKQMFGICAAMAFAAWPLIYWAWCYLRNQERKRMGSRSGLSLLFAIATLLIARNAHPTSDDPRKGPGIGTITFLQTDAEVQYIYNNGSMLTNDYCHIAYTYMVAPGTADFNIAYHPHGSSLTNDWTMAYSGQLSDAGVGGGWYDFSFPGAHTNDWVVYTTWTPGETVITNGVWQLDWMTDRLNHDYVIPKHAAIWYNGRLWMEMRRPLERLEEPVNEY